jgi:exosortase A
MPDAPRLRAWTTLLVGLLGVFIQFSAAWQSMAQIWWHNETYAHGMLVPLVCLWLVWRDRSVLRTLAIRETPAALVALTLCALGWLAGDLAGVNALTHFAVVAMVPSLVLLAFGAPVTRQISFALAFLLTAVPFGDFLLPWLMDRTADFTVGALQASGIPVLREGRNIVLPTGRWSVIEACSGLRYLLAAVPVGLLYAHLHFRHWRTRLAYVGVVLTIALIANWVRAYLIVMLGHLSNMTLAVGVDHLIYGWVFFGLVMGLAFWAGTRLPELGPTPAVAISTRGASPSSAPRSALAIGLALLILSGAPYAASLLQDAGGGQIRMQVLRDALIPLPDEPRAFTPGYRTRDSALGSLPGDPATGIAIYRFFRQHRHGEMITHGNSVVPRTTDGTVWSVRRQSTRRMTTGPGPHALPDTVTEYELESAGSRWLAWEWFWVDGRLCSSPSEVKIATARALLTGRGDESAALVIWTRLTEASGGSPLDAPLQARQRLAEQMIHLRDLAHTAGL